MIINEYSVLIFGVTVTALGFDTNDVAKYFPDAESVILKGSHYFIGDGSDTAQTLAKALPVACPFSATSGETTIDAEHSFDLDPDPEPILSISEGDTVTCTRSDGNPVYVIQWRVHAYVSGSWVLQSTTTGNSFTQVFPGAGTYRVSARSVSDGGQMRDVDGNFWNYYVDVVVT